MLEHHVRDVLPDPSSTPSHAGTTSGGTYSAITSSPMSLSMSASGKKHLLGVGVEASQLGGDLERGPLLRLGGEPTEVGEQHADLHRHPSRRRQLDADRAEARVLARRSVAEGTNDPSTDAGERRAAVPAARRARDRPQHALDRPRAALRNEPPVRLPVSRGQRLTGALAGLLHDTPQRVALHEGQPPRRAVLVIARTSVAPHRHSLPESGAWRVTSCGRAVLR